MAASVLGEGDLEINSVKVLLIPPPPLYSVEDISDLHSN